MSQQRATIEHPNSMGSANKRLLDNLTTIYTAALELAPQGFKIIGVNPTLHIPRIALIYTHHCRRLDSTVKVWGHDELGKYQVHTAHVNGCELIWTMRTAAWLH